ncbi:chaplin [Streptomyces sp. SAJ15]|uniref:chaplin n=1 Tax=Streptomyces sp. SAJ15 TaxID=2011095 RepID=UPI001184A201|nr:chaplin [Streptomyces sp. SAJ15]TVL90699.1 chaplin [Streptomyces sp. SAJ15]
MKNIKKFAAVAIAASGLAVVGAGVASASDHGPQAQGKAVNSPGVASGNLVQEPVDAPVNVGGNTVTVVGAGNSAYDNLNVNH